MNNNELNNQETGVFNVGNTPNNGLNNQTFTDDSLNNFGQTQANPTPSVDLSSQSLQTEPVDTIFANEQPQEVITPSVIQPVNNVAQNLNSSQPVNNVVEEPKVSEPAVEPKQKKSKGPVIVIIFLILIILGLAGYIVYDKFLSNDTKEPETKEEEKTTLKEVKDTELVEELRSELVTKDNTHGLYYNQKITSDNSSDKRLIGFNVRKYVDENNLKYNENVVEYGQTARLLLAVSKTDINEYMNNKYNTDINYTYTSTEQYETLDGNGYPEIVADENNYNIISLNKGYGTDAVKSKLVKAEEDENYVYVYDKYVKCSTEAGWMGCVSSEDEVLGQESMVSCTEGITSEKCPAQATWNNLVDYVLENMSDKLKTFKHTFKKQDGNYFWVSSEVVE